MASMDVNVTRSSDVYDFSDSKYLFKPYNKPISELIRDYLPLLDEHLHQCISIPGTEEPGYSGVYRNKIFSNGLKKTLTPYLTTYHEFFKNAVDLFKDKPCLAGRKYDYVAKNSANEYSSKSFKEIDEMKSTYGSGILYLLQKNPYKNNEKFESHRKIDNHIRDYETYDNSNHSFVACIYSANRPEWLLSDLMCSSYSITNTALYDTLGPDTSEYILHNTQSPVIITSKNHIASIVQLKKNAPKELEHVIQIICLDPLDLKNETPLSSEDQSLVRLCKEFNIELCDLNYTINLGASFPTPELPPTPNSLFTISFTSGTTGSKPKGVLLTHSIAAAAITSNFITLPKIKDIKTFAFLPLAHMFERLNCAYGVSQGACMGFPQICGTPLTLIEDLKIFKPHSMSNVPRIFTKYEAAIKAQTIDHPTSSVTRAVYRKVLNKKMKWHEAHDGADGRHPLYDSLFLDNIRKEFGFDEMKYVITGSAPIAPSTVKFLKASLNVAMLQGYGITETFGGIAYSFPFEAEPGTCGSITVTTEMKLRELPDMGYRLDDPEGPRGELLLRGPQIFKKYYKNEEETVNSIDRNGWYATGDIARLSKDHGRIFIIDRVKNFFKLSQGEYVTPEKIENKYLSSSSVLNQLYVHGDLSRNFLVGVVGIDRVGAVQFLVEKCDVRRGLLSSPELILKELNRKENRTILLNFMNANCREQLQGFERLHNIYIEFEPLRLDRNVVTATQKLKRPVAFKFFSKNIEAMYSEGSLVKPIKL